VRSSVAPQREGGRAEPEAGFGAGQPGREHEPVLLEEIQRLIAPKPGGRYLDGTVGLGGHTIGMLAAAGGEAQVIGMDRDEESLSRARERIREAGLQDAVALYHAPFSRFPEVLEHAGWELVDGALLDLGVSSRQLQNGERGFSFQVPGPLDMRMDRIEGGQSAEELVNAASRERLRRIIRDFGEEPLAGRIANAILHRRQERRIATTSELARIVELAYPPERRRRARNHPATRTFQALRIAVNAELQELEMFLRRIPDYLRPGGRVAVISFHSLEDRTVKHAFRSWGSPSGEEGRQGGRGRGMKIVTKKPIVPEQSELERNIRSRSAKLRVAEAL
jgi:16S rRNA (cytosine1402-N4)-methyltransferase